jgi:hypothetical protein
MVLILAGVGRPHKEITTLVVNPRTGKPIDDVTLRLRFPEEFVPSQGQGIAHPWDLAVGQGHGMLARNHWGWDRPGVTTMALSVPPANSDVLDENGEAKIIIELVKAPKRDD